VEGGRALLELRLVLIRDGAQVGAHRLHLIAHRVQPRVSRATRRPLAVMHDPVALVLDGLEHVQPAREALGIVGAVAARHP